MAAHLHAVPDDPDKETPDSGERPTLLAVVTPQRSPADDVLEDPPADDTDEDEDLFDEGDEDLVHDEEDDGEAAGEGRSWIPNLRPYYDVRPLAELAPLAVEAGRTGGPPLLRLLGRFLRLLGRMLLWYWGGLTVLLALLAGWLSGRFGKGGSVRARLGIVGFLLYCIAKLSSQYPAAPWLFGGAALVVLVLACTGKITVPQPKAAKRYEKAKAPAKADAPAKDTPAGDADTGGEVTKEDAPAEPKRGLLAGLAGRFKSTPAEPSEEAPEETPEEADEDAEEEAPETPAEDPLTALIRKEIGAENGVHLQDLRPAMRRAFPALYTATDADLREILVEAGWDPSRTFRARGAAGRAGVHRDQLPPLPFPKGATVPLSKPLSGGGERPRPANLSEVESGGEWTEEERREGRRFVPDPERGPTAWKIEYLKPRDRR
ncbi:hypothetical protein ABZX75_17395 [Streptomyces sp. NPDC003038]|uniref:hypothetical protein n=1 Tax=unclassified Streptomyces TaxID=2593676 RepID=UPI00339EB2DE